MTSFQRLVSIIPWASRIPEKHHNVIIIISESTDGTTSIRSFLPLASYSLTESVISFSGEKLGRQFSHSSGMSEKNLVFVINGFRNCFGIHNFVTSHGFSNFLYSFSLRQRKAWEAPCPLLVGLGWGWACRSSLSHNGLQAGVEPLLVQIFFWGSKTGPARSMRSQGQDVTKVWADGEGVKAVHWPYL